MKGKRESGKKSKPDSEETTADLPLQYSGEVKVVYVPEPPKAPEGKRIHKRRPLPPVPEGDDAPDPDSSSEKAG